MKIFLVPLLFCFPVLLSAQRPDSLAITLHLDSLLRSVRPFIEQQMLDKAMAITEEAEQKTLAAFGTTHPAYAVCLALKGKIAQRRDNFKEAADWLLKSMAVQEKIFGKESLQYATNSSILSSIYLNAGEYSEAEPYLRQTLATREKLLGKQHPDYARVLGTLGTLNFLKGNFGEAELLYQQAAQVIEKTMGKKHPEYGFILGNLSSVYTETGNYDKAEPLMAEVSAINAAAYGTKSTFYIKALNNQATLYFRMGELDKSEAIYLEIKAILDGETNKETEARAQVLGNLASIFMEKGAFEKAAPLLTEAEQICAQVFGKQHVEYAIALKNTGQYYTATGEFEKAETYLRQAHQINTTQLDPAHPNTATSATMLARICNQTGRLKEAGQLFLEANRINRQMVERAAGYSSELEMLNFLQKYQHATDEFYAFVQAHPDPELQAAAFDNALFYKGFVLNASIQVKNRALADPKTAADFGLLYAYRHRLSDLSAQPVSGRDNAALTAIEQKINGLEKALTRQMVGFELGLQQTDWKEVQAALKPGEAAVEFIHFQSYDRLGKRSDSIYYAALVVRSGTGKPELIPLFEAGNLNRLLQGASGGNFRKINGLYALGQGALYNLLWQKLEAPLKGTSKVYTALSGQLHRLNISAITLIGWPGPQIVILGSTRQLVLPPPPVDYKQYALLVGGVDYTNAQKPSLAALGTETRSITNSEQLRSGMESLRNGENWNFLPGTLTEVLNVQNILQESKFSVMMDTSLLATEESIKETGALRSGLSPRILHFATHGYFFPDPKIRSSNGDPEELAFKSAKNPLLRSGLILAGAQKTWSAGGTSLGQQDGVLTAQEISLLDFSGTELVVLSACETGLGDIDANEGVYGLQRAFKIAGVKYIIMSLWKVNDRSSLEFMTEFYRQWIKKGLKIPDAFQRAQQTLKSRYPNEAYHWAGFVLVQ